MQRMEQLNFELGKLNGVENPDFPRCPYRNVIDDFAETRGAINEGNADKG
jgi:hypothetical protein